MVQSHVVMSAVCYSHARKEVPDITEEQHRRLVQPVAAQRVVFSKKYWLYIAQVDRTDAKDDLTLAAMNLKASR